VSDAGAGQRNTGPVEARTVEAAVFVRSRIHTDPVIGLILGSGLGEVASAVENAVAVPYSEIPGFPSSAVAGHAGLLIAGDFAGVPAIVMQGRFHHYEGHPAGVVALPVRLLIRLGIRILVVTNAAGGINRQFRAGDLMLIDDHINLMGANPLTGPVNDGEQRFPDMSAPYDPALMAIVERVALEKGIPLRCGVYCALPGPSYETPAEVRMLDRFGADAVGMSTAPEVIVARASGVRVVGVSIITNAASSHSGTVSHEEVLQAGHRAVEPLRHLLLGAAPLMANS
jgi:purine-nucleoside phosphorylase